MKKIILILLFISFNSYSMSLYDFKVQKINGKTLDLNTYKGRPMLVVNIATHCGYTYQLKGLEKLYQKYKGQNFMVLGVPSNDFGGQTPEGEKEVAKFCKKKYGVSFPLTQKTTVLGPNKTGAFKYLTSEQEIAWNFEKFLVDSNGKLVKRFRSSMQPLSPQIRSEIERLLEQK